MSKELSIGNLTDREKAEMDRLAAQFPQVQAIFNAAFSQALQHGISLGKLCYRIEHAHKWDHSAAYRYAPNGEVFRVIPDQPPVGESLEVKESEVN